MGGCGKTTMTVAAVRDPVVRRHFECIAWQAVSQIPNISDIQAQFSKQLFKTRLSDEAASDVGLGFTELQHSSIGRTLLVCLDDVSNTCFNPGDSDYLNCSRSGPLQWNGSSIFLTKPHHHVYSYRLGEPLRLLLRLR